MELEEQFQAASKFLPNIVTKVASEDLLFFYARYKQATVGPCNTPKPGFFEFQAKQKWNAWKSIEPMSKEDAMKEYVTKLNQLEPDWVDKDPEDVKDTSWVSVSCMPKPVVDDADKDFLYFLQEGDVSKVSEMLIHDSSLATIILEDLYPIHWAADRGNEAMVQILIKNGANVNVQDEDGQTALHYACSVGHEQVIEVLLKAGADVNIVDNEGLKPEEVLKNDIVKAKYFTHNQ